MDSEWCMTDNVNASEISRGGVVVVHSQTKSAALVGGARLVFCGAGVRLLDFG